MDNSFSDKNFNLAAQWAIQHDFFVASVLARYSSIKQIKPEEIAPLLGCSQEDLSRLSLCRKPNTETPFSFRKDVEQIASYVGIDRTRLAQLFREVESLEALQSAPQNSKAKLAPSVLVAARDHTEQEVPENENRSDTDETTNNSESVNQLNSSDNPNRNESLSELILVETDEYEAATNETLEQTLDLDTWLPGEDLVTLYERLGQEVEEAVHQENRIRQRIRQEIFPRLRERLGAPRNAGLYRAKIEDIERVHRKILFNGGVEACDATSVVHDTLAVTIAQIGVCTISYQGTQGSYVHHLYRRDLRAKGLDPVEEALEILEQRKKRDGFDVDSQRDKLSNLMRRGIMTYAERAVLMRKCNARWRMGHGNPIAYELLTGSGMPELIGKSLEILRELVSHKQFVFVPSSTSDRLLLTIGNALQPLEYAIVETSKRFMDRVLGGHFTGKWLSFLPDLKEFAANEGNQIVVGMYRASEIAPSQLFYAHIDHAHEAALIAMADSVLQEHRGFPMLIDLADNICRTTFGADSFNTSTQLAYTEADAPFQYMTERQTRGFLNV